MLWQYEVYEIDQQDATVIRRNILFHNLKSQEIHEMDSMPVATQTVVKCDYATIKISTYTFHTRKISPHFNYTSRRHLCSLKIQAL